MAKSKSTPPRNAAAAGHVTMRMWVSTNAILRALSEYEDKDIIRLVDEMARERAARHGFSIETKQVGSSVDFDKKEISLVIPAP